MLVATKHGSIVLKTQNHNILAKNTTTMTSVSHFIYMYILIEFIYKMIENVWAIRSKLIFVCIELHAHKIKCWFFF